MPFKDSSTLQSRINDAQGRLICTELGTVFYLIRPNALKKRLKPASTAVGPYTDYNNQITANLELLQKAKNKLIENELWGDAYDNQEASLKLHININNIGEQDENVILGLIDLLIKESENPDNNIHFEFKIIKPKYHAHKRFQDTDQLTVYFDKYSSTGGVIQLTKTIEAFLLENKIPENTKKLGPKESFGFNPFVSARFDTNKLLQRYEIHKFFDLELKIFFERHPDASTLNDVPLYGFEAVFNTLITHSKIKSLNGALSKEDSEIAQQELDFMIQNPRDYMKNFLNNGDPAEGFEQQQQESAKLDETLLKHYNYLKKPGFFNASQQKQIASFTQLLKKLRDKGDGFAENSEEQRAIRAVHSRLQAALNNFTAASPQNTYEPFASECKQAIQQANQSVLKNHRGIKEVLYHFLQWITHLGKPEGGMLGSIQTPSIN